MPNTELPEVEKAESAYLADCAKFDALKAEREAWPSDYAAAVRVGDADSMIAQEARRAKLEASGAPLKVKRLQSLNAWRETRLSGALQNRDEAIEELRKCEKALAAAQSRHDLAQRDAMNTGEAVRDLQSDIAATKREIEDVASAAAKPPAPIVRTLQTSVQQGYFTPL